MKRGTVLGAAIFVLVGFQLVFHQNHTLSERARQRDAAAAAQAIYQSDLLTFTTAMNAYTLCLDGVERSDANRGQWQVAIDQLRSAGLDSGADILAAGPLMSTAPRTVADCGEQPVPPEAPPDLAD